MWFPSVSIDPNWTPLKQYIETELKVDTEKENCFFDEHSPTKLEAVIKRQHKKLNIKRIPDINKFTQY